MRDKAEINAAWKVVIDRFYEKGDVEGALAIAETEWRAFPEYDDYGWRVAWFIREARLAARFSEAESILRALIEKQPTRIEYSQALLHLLDDQQRVIEARDVVKRYLENSPSEIFEELRDGMITAGIWYATTESDIKPATPKAIYADRRSR